jgi:hypothetical protein
LLFYLVQGEGDEEGCWHLHNAMRDETGTAYHPECYKVWGATFFCYQLPYLPEPYIFFDGSGSWSYLHNAKRDETLQTWK